MKFFEKMQLMIILKVTKKQELYLDFRRYIFRKTTGELNLRFFPFMNCLKRPRSFWAFHYIKYGRIRVYTDPCSTVTNGIVDSAFIQETNEITDSAVIQENKGQGKPLFSQIFCRYL